MTFSANRILSGRITAAAALFAVCIVAAAAQAQLSQSATSADGLLTLVLTSTNASDTPGVNNTYTWTAVNNSTTTAVSDVVLGSHWGDWCGPAAGCTPPGPTLISAPGCAGQGPAEIPVDARFGVWCTPLTGVLLLPGESVSGSVTLRPLAGGPPDYFVYSFYTDPKTGALVNPGSAPQIRHSNLVNPAPTDIQIKGSASNGGPATGSTFTYTYEIKNSGPWGTFGGITFTDTLPDSLTLVSAIVSPRAALAAAACGVLDRTVTCPLNELQNGAQATVTLTVTASGNPQQIANTASALTVAPQTDSNTANNNATVTVTTK